jgi:predicted RNA-binding Zn ribbon-like protein
MPPLVAPVAHARRQRGHGPDEGAGTATTRRSTRPSDRAREAVCFRFFEQTMNALRGQWLEHPAPPRLSVTCLKSTQVSVTRQGFSVVYHEDMFDIRTHDNTAPAPGDLELVQRFINLHEHAPDVDGDLPPSREMVEMFLRERELLEERTRFTEADHREALALRRALHAKVRARDGEPMPDRDVRVIDSAAQRAGLRPDFGGQRPSLVPSEKGVAGALGRLVASAFLAALEGTWDELKACAGPDCASVFYDRSKNHSGRWCSMSTCGNRAKVRAWRDRHRTKTRSRA